MLPPGIPTMFELLASIAIPTNSVKGTSSFLMSYGDLRLLNPTLTLPMILLRALSTILTFYSGALFKRALIPRMLPAIFSSMKICFDNFWLTKYIFKHF